MLTNMLCRSLKDCKWQLLLSANSQASKMQRMKSYYDAAVKPKKFEERQKVYDPGKKGSLCKVASVMEGTSLREMTAERQQLCAAKYRWDWKATPLSYIHVWTICTGCQMT